MPTRREVLLQVPREALLRALGAHGLSVADPRVKADIVDALVRRIYDEIRNKQEAA